LTVTAEGRREDEKDFVGRRRWVEFPVLRVGVRRRAGLSRVLGFGQGASHQPAVLGGNTVYLSGQIGIVAGTMKLASGGIKEEARQTIENIKSSLEAHGYFPASKGGSRDT